MKGSEAISGIIPGALDPKYSMSFEELLYSKYAGIKTADDAIKAQKDIHSYIVSTEGKSEAITGVVGSAAGIAGALTTCPETVGAGCVVAIGGVLLSLNDTIKGASQYYYGEPTRSPITVALVESGAMTQANAEYTVWAANAGLIVINLAQTVKGIATLRIRSGSEIKTFDIPESELGGFKFTPNPVLKTGVDLDKVEVLTVAQAKQLGGSNKGVIFVQENAKMSEAAADFENSATGAFSDVLSQRKAAPALRYDNPTPNGNSTNNFVKFDGIEPDGVTLINRKLSLTARSKQIASLRRMESAIKQNPGYKAVLEFPNAGAALRADVILKAKNIRNITVRVAK